MKTTEPDEQACSLCWEAASREMEIMGETAYSYLAVAPADMQGDYVIAPKHHIEQAILLPDMWQRQISVLLHGIMNFDEWDGYYVILIQPTLRNTVSHVHALVIRRYDEPEQPHTVEASLGREALRHADTL